MTSQNTCKLWTGTLDGDGYGRDGYYKLAHRLAWSAINGPIPSGMVIMHTCDVRACVNPKHLRIGSQTENNHDMARKGRGLYHTVITDAQVAEMRNRSVLESNYKIAREFGVSMSQVAKIRTGTARVLRTPANSPKTTANNER